MIFDDTLRGLYPSPAKRSDPPCWQDIEALALHYPVVHTCVALADRGDWTREQALIAMTHALATAFGELFRQEVERRQTTLPTRIVLPAEY